MVLFKAIIIIDFNVKTHATPLNVVLNGYVSFLSAETYTEEFGHFSVNVRYFLLLNFKALLQNTISAKNFATFFFQSFHHLKCHGHYTHHTRQKWKISHFCHTVFMCFLQFSEERVGTFLHSISLVMSAVENVF